MKKRIALALVLGSTMAFGAVACDSGSDDSGDSGGDDSGVSAACLETDTDSMTYTFVVDTLQIPKAAPNSDGFNIDGRGTTKASDQAGCFWVDTKASGSTRVDVDNQLATVNSLAASTLSLDISKALQDAITPPGAATPSIVLQAVVSHWNGTLTDPCIQADLQVKTGDGPFVSAGTTVTKITSGVTPVFGISNPVALAVTITLPTTTCTAGSYMAGSDGAIACGEISYDCSSTIPIEIRGLKIRAHVEAAGSGFRLVTNRPINGESSVVNPSLLAGYLTYWQNDGATRPSCDPAVTPPAGTFEAAMKQAVCDLGQGGLWGVACGLIAQNLDLRDDGTGSVAGGCTSGTNNTTSNANSISIAAYVGSDYP